MAKWVWSERQGRWIIPRLGRDRLEVDQRFECRECGRDYPVGLLTGDQGDGYVCVRCYSPPSQFTGRRPPR